MTLAHGAIKCTSRYRNPKDNPKNWKFAFGLYQHKRVEEYVQRFSAWLPYEHRVLGQVKDITGTDRIVPVPPNIGRIFGTIYYKNYTDRVRNLLLLIQYCTILTYCTVLLGLVNPQRRITFFLSQLWPERWPKQWKLSAGFGTAPYQADCDPGQSWIKINCFNKKLNKNWQETQN